jgi:hypothetical protein
MIRFHCECGQLLQISDEHAGKLAKCPACGSQRDVPFTSEAVHPLSFAPPSQPARSGRVQTERPALEGYDDLRPDDRPRSRQSDGSSGKATASLILGLLGLFCTSILTGIPAIIFGILGLKDIGRSGGRLGGKGLAVTGIITGGLSILCLPVGLIAFFAGRAGFLDAANRAQAKNNITQIGLAMFDYHSSYGHFPGAAVSTPGPNNPFPGNPPGGKPRGLSWRVALLPYLGEDALYQRFRLDEEWDSPNNKPLLAQMPKVYQMPGQSSNVPAGHTFYQVIVGPGALFDPQMPNGCRVIDVTDGTSNTIMIVEADQAVPWTKPDDLTFAPNGPLPKFGTHWKGGFFAVFADSSVHWIPSETPDPTLRALITRNGGEMVNVP